MLAEPEIAQRDAKPAQHFPMIHHASPHSSHAQQRSPPDPGCAGATLPVPVGIGAPFCEGTTLGGTHPSLTGTGRVARAEGA
jgi:hypothetical protein